jgi:microcystin-dependent protein
MSYSINNTFNPFPFIGQIVAYGGTTDPPGWVICDGVPRSNSDGRYNNLLTMSIGSGSTTYTPLDLSGHLLCGFDSTYTLGSKYTLKDNAVTLISSNIPAHTHGSLITASGSGDHTHTYDDDYFTEDVAGVTVYNRSNSASGDGTGFNTLAFNTDAASYTNHEVTIGSTGSNAAFSVQQQSLPINWIIKL